MTNAPPSQVEGFRLVDGGWEALFDDSMAAAAGERLRIVCPFIKRGVVERLLKIRTPSEIEVLTRYDLRAFGDGVSDVGALALLLAHGARIRGVRNLHAKVFQFGASRVIVTSANLTRAAMRSNHEFGFVAEQPHVAERTGHYFDELWHRAGPDLTAERVGDWQQIVDAYRLRGAPPAFPGLGDEGADVGLPAEESIDAAVEPLVFRSFVKFFGNGGDRALRTAPVWEQVHAAECHWACTYPKGKRPRQVQDGSIMFMAWLVEEPEDIIVFGRAIGMRHVDGRDDATEADIARRDWKAKWPHYVRVHHAQFLAGDLRGGVSLNMMMDDLGPAAFATTQQRADAGETGINVRRAYARQAHVELTPASHRWLDARLEEAFARHGRMAPATFDAIGWHGAPIASTLR